MNSKQLGFLGEKIAENYLKKKGYQILDKNYSFRIPDNPQRGEIDIVAKKGDIISFFEVKTLKNPSLEISPEEKVDFSKQRKLIKTAESWLMRKKLPLNSQWQIDVISINLNNNQARIRHFQNAVF
jgi:putative endonuclease